MNQRHPLGLEFFCIYILLRNSWQELSYFSNMEDYSKIVIDKIDHVKCPIWWKVEQILILSRFNHFHFSLDSVENVRELPCRHIFCFNCLETYKREKEAFVCPLCKKEISKRKLLTRDAALESLSIFFRTLGDDVKLHHKTDSMLLQFFLKLVQLSTTIYNYWKNRNITLILFFQLDRF